MFTKRGKLDSAIVNNDLDGVRAVLARYPDLAKSRGARKSMSLAIRQASDEIVFALSDAGCNLLETKKDLCCLQEATTCGRNEVIAAWCDSYPYMWTKEFKAKLLKTAIIAGQTETLKFLLDQNISDISLCDYYHDPLYWAQSIRYPDAVQIISAHKKTKNTIYLKDFVVKEIKEEIEKDVEEGAEKSDAPAWHVVDDTTIMRVRYQSEAGYRLTDIFNFAMGNCISLQRNLETDHETAVTSDLTSPASTVAAEQAHEQLIKRGGNPPPLAKPIVKKAIGE